jgi:transposase InsO family protein
MFWGGKPSRRSQEDERIKAAHKRTRESYSARRFQPELAADGFIAGRDRIAHLRRECAHDYRKLLEQFGMQASMSRRRHRTFLCDP